MNPDLKTHISNILKESITKISSVHGGDISTAYRIDTLENSYFLKTNSALHALDMFQSEAYGLQLISKTNTIKTPTVLACDKFEHSSFLLLEFIESKSPSPVNFKNLGVQLAKLHQNTSDSFGLDHDNFIGSLQQSNNQHTSWVEFYTQERLLPQFQLAKQQQLLSDNECPSENRMKETLSDLFQNIKPSLLHGDLWSGNYVISTKGDPYLLDPAVYFGHHEVDIAMTQLFGGFGNDFYKGYQSILPQDSKTAARLDIYQLYYLLVHLNLFGASYYNSVKSILKKYF